MFNRYKRLRTNAGFRIISPEKRCRSHALNHEGGSLTESVQLLLWSRGGCGLVSFQNNIQMHHILTQRGRKNEKVYRNIVDYRSAGMSYRLSKQRTAAGKDGEFNDS